MLPEALIEQFSLLENQERPTLSLYVDLDLESGEVLTHATRIERIRVTQNLFHENLKGQINQDALEDPAQSIPYGDFLRPLWTATQRLRQQREEARGWPENNDRAEFLFELEGPADDPNLSVHLIPREDRKSTRLSSSHVAASYAVFGVRKENILPTADGPPHGGRPLARWLAVRT